MSFGDAGTDTADRGWTPAAAGVGAITLAVLLVAGCSGDRVTEPLTDLRIESVEPSPFRAGQEIVVRGPGVAHARAYINGLEAERVSARNGVLTLRAPMELPECGEPLPRVSLILEAAAFRDSTVVQSQGSPVAIDLQAGDHAVVNTAGLGCEMRLLHAGVYGAAIYRTAEFAVSADVRTRRLPFGVSVRNAARSAMQLRQPRISAGLPATSPRVFPHPSVRGAAAHMTAFQGTPCVTEPAAIGDTIAIRDFATGEPFAAVVAAATTHFAFLVEPDSLTSLRSAGLDRLADGLERRVLPFLLRAFDGWPDHDGDGRLNIIVGRIDGGVYPGGGLTVDGCAGDFIQIAWAYIDHEDERRNNPWTVIVHEATHWYDSGPDRRRLNQVADWTIEGYASLGARLWGYEDEGRSAWENAPLSCGPGCRRILLEENRYGSPGLSRDSGYGHGSHILMYLLQQAVAPGDPLFAAFAGLRNRAVGRDIVGLRPIFEAAGGTGRTETQLQGEFLLAHYADDFVAGISQRLMLPEWDLVTDSSFPLFQFRLDSENPDGTVSLARPDGVLIEIVAARDAVFSVEPYRRDVAVAFVRAH